MLPVDLCVYDSVRAHSGDNRRMYITQSQFIGSHVNLSDIQHLTVFRRDVRWRDDGVVSSKGWTLE